MNIATSRPGAQLGRIAAHRQGAARGHEATRDLGAMGHEEVQALIDQITAAAPDKAPVIQGMRPR